MPPWVEGPGLTTMEPEKLAKENVKIINEKIERWETHINNLQLDQDELQDRIHFSKARLRECKEAKIIKIGEERFT